MKTMRQSGKSFDKQKRQLESDKNAEIDSLKRENQKLQHQINKLEQQLSLRKAQRAKSMDKTLKDEVQ